MKRLFKKTGAIFLASAIFAGSAVTVLPRVVESGITVNAAEYNGFSYDFDSDGTVIITGYNKNGEMVIPSKINGKKVTKIKSYAFKDKIGLQSVTIPGSVKTIEEYAFSGCIGIQKLTIKNGVESIGVEAFSNCIALKEVNIPDSVKSLETNWSHYRGAFMGCTALKKVKIGKGLNFLGGSTFYGCSSLEEITLSDNITEMQGRVFGGCSKLKSIKIPGKIGYIGEDTFSGCTSLKSITIPSNIKSIGENAFYGCTALQNVYLKNGLETIGQSAFGDCTALKEISLPNSLKELQTNWSGYYGVFTGCTALEKVNLGNSITKLGGAAFRNCTSLKSIVIPDSLQELGCHAFAGCSSLKSAIILGTNLTDFSHDVFLECTALENVYLGNGVIALGNSAFKGCSELKTITIPNTATKICYSAFADCSKLSKVIIPDNVTVLEERIFQNVSNDITIYGTYGSYAEKFASENNIKFSKATYVSNLKLSNTKLSLNKNDKYTLKATVSPNGATDKFVYWISSNPNVVSVSNGNIVGKSSGIATITALSGSKTATCSVTVYGDATSIRLNKTSVKLEKGKSTLLSATVLPAYAKDKTVKWTSSNTKVATVSNGKITAKGVGTATITAKTVNGKKATCKVTVQISPTKVKLSRTSVSLNKGKSTTIKATVTPSNATNKKVTWTTSNKKVATVSNGKITAKGTGTATITVKTANGKKATCKVTVQISPTKVKLSKTSVTLGKGKSTTIKATVTPSNATNKKVTWTTSNKKVATVSNGKITAKGTGTATITVKTANGKKATCKVTVKNLPTRVKLNRTSATLKKGKTLTLKATVTPSKNVISTVSWTSSNSRVAYVKNGKITAKAKGKATITVKTTNGKTAKCRITVK